jgi:hypothetical protein
LHRGRRGRASGGLRHGAAPVAMSTTATRCTSRQSRLLRLPTAGRCATELETQKVGGKGVVRRGRFVQHL